MPSLPESLAHGHTTDRRREKDTDGMFCVLCGWFYKLATPEELNAVPAQSYQEIDR